MAFHFAQKPTDAIHLQGIGLVHAKPARDFAIGEFAVWNYGHTSEILAATPKGKTQILWRTRTSDGKEWDRVVKADRLVAYTNAGRHLR